MNIPSFDSFLEHNGDDLAARVVMAVASTEHLSDEESVVCTCSNAFLIACNLLSEYHNWLVTVLDISADD